MSTNHRSALALLFFALIIALGAFGYMAIEGYDLLGSLYMTVITITTVGYGEVAPLSNGGRMFTIVLIVSGFCCLTFLGHSLADALIQSAVNQNKERRKMEKRIRSLEGHHIVCGFGRVGRSAVAELARAGAPLVILDSNPEVDEEIHRLGHLHIPIDATSEEGLLAAGVASASGLLAVLPSDALNLFITLTARDLNPRLHIVARSEEATTIPRLIRAGADRVVSPFANAGTEVARDLLGNAGASEAAEVNRQSVWVDEHETLHHVGATLAEVAENHGGEVVGLRRGGHDTIHPGPETLVQMGDTLLLVPDLHRSVEGGAGGKTKARIVIATDSPSLSALYARAMRRVGLIPHVVRSGREALEAILEDRPSAALLDMALADLPGDEICERIGSDGTESETQLLLLAESDGEANLTRATECGAAALISKSDESVDVIQRVFEAID